MQSEKGLNIGRRAGWRLAGVACCAGVLAALLVWIALYAAPVRATPMGVGLVTDTGTLDDRAFNWLSAQGLLRAESELGVAGRVYTSYSSGSYLSNLSQCVADGNTLCIAVGFTMFNAVSATAAIHPAVKFALVDMGVPTTSVNLRGLVFAEDQSGYLAGTLAGLMSSSRTIGGIGGPPIPAVVRFVQGYRQGAECAKPGTTVLISQTAAFDDPNAGAQMAQAQLALGADVIFAVAGDTGNGAILTATQSGAWAIGVDVDQYETVFLSGTVPGASRLLSSARKRIDNAVFSTIQNVVSGTFTAGNLRYDVGSTGVDLAPFHLADASVPPAVRQALARVQHGLAAGTIDPGGPCPAYLYLPYVAK